MTPDLLPTEAELRDRYVLLDDALLDDALLGEEPTGETPAADVHQLRGAA